MVAISPSHGGFPSQLGQGWKALRGRPDRSSNLRVLAKAAEKGEERESGGGGGGENKKSLFSSVTEALDFSAVRSSRDAELLDDARQATKAGGRMTREQVKTFAVAFIGGYEQTLTHMYGALRRKIGGTYKDFFKSYIEVDGQYVEEGWVDKTCKVCKKDTGGEARQVDKLGRYVHVACLEKPNSSPGNFFSKLFSK